MPTVTATPDVVSFPDELREATEIRDVKGKVLGVFTPRSVTGEDGLWTTADLREAEHVLAAEAGQGRPRAEIWRDIHSHLGSA